MAARLTLYVRDGCNLCDEAAVVLDAMIGADAYDKADISRSDDLLFGYAHRIPVLAVDGVDRLDAPITAPDIRALLDSVEGVRGA
ncbi:MAG: glutaredoxin family protein [Candidatus Limnocylindria bacterium]